MGEHHFVGLAAKTRLLVTTEWSMSRVSMIAIDPHTASLDGTRYLITLMDIASPHTRTQPINSVICNGNGFLFRFEFDSTSDWPKDLFLKNAHIVSSSKDCWLDVEATRNNIVCSSTRQHLGTFRCADVDVVGDAFMLLL